MPVGRAVRRPTSVVLAALAALALVVSAPTAGGAESGAAAAACVPRTLVLSAMPVELGPLLAQQQPSRRVSGHGRDYFVGRLRGRDTVLALTGIGPVNARRHTAQALREFRCGSRTAIQAIVFSGVAGGDYIGDVTVPAQWTLDDGKHLLRVDPGMLGVARRVARSRVPLEQKAPVGDPACACAAAPDTATTVSVTHRPRITVGGAGRTTDPFSGRALPCAPAGGDVFGCEPCVLQEDVSRDAPTFGTGVVPFVDPAFFTGYFSSTSSSGHKYVADDEETAAVAKVAAAEHIPFIGFRAVSDGGGDPLHLPGFPVQFFYYRQLAADNAARATSAFLAAWRPKHAA